MAHPAHDHAGHGHGAHDHGGHGHAAPHGARSAHGGPARAGEERKLLLTLVLACVAVVVECVGGFVTNSLALVSDGGHMLADAFAIALSLFAVRMAARPADARRTYGYYRLEILAALFNGAALIAIAAWIAIEAVGRLRHPLPVDTRLVVWLACSGIVLNALGLWLTHGGAHGSMNLRSTFLHLAGDLLNSIGVLVSAALIAWTGRLELDALVSFLIAGTIIWSAVRLCREAVDVLLEGVPPHLDLSEVNAGLGSLRGVSAVHDLHVWTITSGLVALSCHLVVACDGPGCRGHDEILSDAKQVLRERFQIVHTTIQFESPSFRHEDPTH